MDFEPLEPKIEKQHWLKLPLPLHSIQLAPVYIILKDTDTHYLGKFSVESNHKAGDDERHTVVIIIDNLATEHWAKLRQARFRLSGLGGIERGDGADGTPVYRIQLSEETFPAYLGTQLPDPSPTSDE